MSPSQPSRLSQALLSLSICLVIGLAWKLLPHPALAIAMGLLPVMMLFVLGKPFLMVLLFVLFSFFRLHEVFPQLYSLKIPLLLSLASLFALMWHVGISRKIEIYWRTELTVISLFFILVIIGVLFASNRPVAIAYFKNIYWKIALMTFAIAWLSRSVEDFDFASKMITLSGLVVGITAVINKLSGIGLVEGTRVTIGRELGSVLGDPNDLALVLILPCAFAVSLMSTPQLPRMSRLLGFISVPILFYAVIATQSRGGLLGILAIFAVFGYQRIKSKTLLLLIGCIAALALFAFAGISDRASGGAAEAGIDASAMGRLYAWEAAFGMALHNPLTGVGIDNFYSNYYYYSPHWDGLNHAVHSTWFGILAETGFLGLAVFVTLIIMLIRTALRSLKKLQQINKPIDPVIHATAQAVLAGLIGTVVSGTFLTQGFTWPIYILAALVVALAHWVDTETAKSRMGETHQEAHPKHGPKCTHQSTP